MNRRTFLRGALLGSAGAVVGLPLLDAMLNDGGTALADGGEIPTRFGVWFWGNGVRPEHWVPSATGADYPLSAELAPLAGVKSHLSVISGCEIKTATHPHHSGMTGIMTGQRYFQNGTTRDTIVSTFAGPSVDQIAAEHYDGQTPFRSLEVGITRFRGTDEGTTFQHLSHNGPNNPNPSEYSPSAMYARLFAVPVESQVTLARRSVLDGVMGQITELEGRVGRSDRARLDQHFESVRTLERRLETGPSVCTTPVSPGDFGDVGGNEQIDQQNRAMSDLCAVALACDMTRAFSMFFSTAGSGVIMWPVGATNGLHQINHDQPAPFATVHAATTYTMEQLAYFLERLRDTPEGTGSVLDNVSILGTTELTEGWTHSNSNFPILVAGRGGGRLRGNVHYRSPSAHNASHAVLTALRGGGVPAASFGADAGYVTDSFSELEV